MYLIIITITITTKKNNEGFICKYYKTLEYFT